MYFHRALKMNPQYLSAWTLLGHEFMEMKNTNGAIHSYRQAIGKLNIFFLCRQHVISSICISQLARGE